jgi:exosome complex RNA-binding protein Csl4
MRLKFQPVKKRVFELEGEGGDVVLSLTLKTMTVNELDQLAAIEQEQPEAKTMSEAIERVARYCEDFTDDKREFFKALDLVNAVAVMRALADMMSAKDTEEKKSP